MRLDKLVALVERQHATGVGQGMDHHRRVLPRLDDFIEIADGTSAHRQRQRPIMPDRALRREKEAAREIGGRHILVSRDGHQRPAEPPGHMLDKPCLAAAGRPFQHDGKAIPVGRLEERHLRAGGAVVRFSLDPVSVHTSPLRRPAILSASGDDTAGSPSLSNRRYGCKAHARRNPGGRTSIDCSSRHSAEPRPRLILGARSIRSSRSRSARSRHFGKPLPVIGFQARGRPRNHNRAAAEARDRR